MGEGGETMETRLGRPARPFRSRSVRKPARSSMGKENCPWSPYSRRQKLQGSPGSEKQSSSPVPSEGQGQISFLRGVLGNSVWVGRVVCVGGGAPAQLLVGCADNSCFFLPLLLLQPKAQVTCDQGWPFLFVQESLLGWVTFCP